MIFWALFACLLVDYVVAVPVGRHDDNGKFGYEYDVRHPAGSSRVHVSSGSDRNRNSYPHKARNFRNEDYIPDATYDSPHYVGPIYKPNSHRHYYPGPSHDYGRSKVPVYEEPFYSRPAGLQPSPPHGHFQTYNRPARDYPSNHEISQSDIDAGPLYEKSVAQIPVSISGPNYPNPHFIQQESIEEAIPSKLEQVPLEPNPVVQQASFDDFSEPSIYPKTYIPQLPIDKGPFPTYTKHEQSPIDQKVLVDEQSPIDQQVLVDEQFPTEQQTFVDDQKEIPVLFQKPLDEKPKISQVFEDIPSVKTVPIVKGSPIVQQSSVDIIPPSSIQQYEDDGKLSQVVVEDKPSFYEPPIVQQVADHGPNHFIKQLPFGDVATTYGSRPIIQKTIDERPYQAVYDSPIEPSFSDHDRFGSPKIYTAQPRYRFVPVGPPYEKISHSTEIIHGPPRRFYSPRGPPHKYIKASFPIIKNPPYPHSVKLPPPPPPPIGIKSAAPVNVPYSQKHVDADILLTKNPPVSHSVKLPPPAPIIKTIEPIVLSQAQEHIDGDILLTKNPPILQSIKLPPPSVATKSVTPINLPQEHIDADLLLAKQSIKLPPPAPVTKTVALSPVQQHVEADILSKDPVSHSVKLPHPVIKTLIPDAQEHIVAIPQSIKYPPPSVKSVVSVKGPPPPITKSAIPFDVPPPPITKSVSSVKIPPPITKIVVPIKPNIQENVDADILLTKTPPVQQSIKLPPPPITKSVAPVILLQEPELLEIPQTKNAPYSVKHPPASKSAYFDKPKYPSVVSHFSKPHYTDSIPPSSYSVKQPHSVPFISSNPDTHYDDSQSHLDVPLTEISPISHGVKHPVVSNVHSVKHPKGNAKVPHVNPHFSALLSAGDREDYPASHSIKQPHSPLEDYELKSASPHLKQALINSPKKYSPTVQDAYSVPEEELDSNVPQLEHPYFDEPAEEKSLTYPPGFDTVELSPAIPPAGVKSSSVTPSDELSIPGIGESTPFDKDPSVSTKAISVPNLFAAIPTELDDESGASQDSDIPLPKSEALISPGPRSARNSYRHGGEPNQEFPAFPESAFKQKDPVADKVAELTNSFRPGEGYAGSNGEPEDDSDDESPNSASIEDAKAEVERINREIGSSFGNRLYKRSRYSRFS